MEWEQQQHHLNTCSQRHLWPHWPPSHPLHPRRHQRWRRCVHVPIWWHRMWPPPRHRPHHIHMPPPPPPLSSVHYPVRGQRQQHQFIVYAVESSRKNAHSTTCKRLDWPPLPWMSRSTASQNHSVSSGARPCVASSSGVSDVNSYAVDAKTCPVGNVHVAAGGAHSLSGCVASAPAVPMARCCCVPLALRCLAASVGALEATYATTTFTLATIKELTSTTISVT